MHMCNTAILPSMLFGPLTSTRTHRQSQLLARAIQWWPEQPEAEHTNIVAATTCVYTQNCSQVLPVLFSNFANYYFVPVLISNRQSSISFDWEKWNFNKGIRHILIQRSILRYFFLFLFTTYKSWMCRDICRQRREIMAQLEGSWFVFVTLGVGVKDISCSGKATQKILVIVWIDGGFKAQFF